MIGIARQIDGNVQIDETGNGADHGGDPGDLCFGFLARLSESVQTLVPAHREAVRRPLDSEMPPLAHSREHHDMQNSQSLRTSGGQLFKGDRFTGILEKGWKFRSCSHSHAAARTKFVAKFVAEPVKYAL